MRKFNSEIKKLQALANEKRAIDEIDIEDLNSLPKEFLKNPKGYIKLRDAIFGMEED